MNAQSNQLIRQHAKQKDRRFSAEPMTGFGSIDEIGSDRYFDVRDHEGADHDREEHRAAVERGE